MPDDPIKQAQYVIEAASRANLPDQIMNTAVASNAARALAAAGLLAAPAAQPPTPREWMNARDTEPRDCGRVRDRDGVIWCRRSDGGWHAEESGKWAWQFWPAFVDRHGPLTEVLPTTEVDAFEGHASPAAPADDEAAKNAALKLADTIAFEAYRAWAASSNRDAYVDVAIRNAAKSAALAALREGKQ